MSATKARSQSPGSDAAPRPQKASVRAVANATKAANGSLAPDGLPWPKGYFDRPARQSLEDAIAKYGVRPCEYYKGWPCYTWEETALPEYKGKLPDEPVELQEQWRREWETWKAWKKVEGARA